MGVIQKKTINYALLLAILIISPNSGYADPPTLCTTDAEIQSKVLEYDRANPAEFSKKRYLDQAIYHTVNRPKKYSTSFFDWLFPPPESGSFLYTLGVHYKNNVIEKTKFFVSSAYRYKSEIKGRWSIFLDYLYLRDIAKKDLGQDIPFPHQITHSTLTNEALLSLLESICDNPKKCSILKGNEHFHKLFEPINGKGHNGTMTVGFLDLAREKQYGSYQVSEAYYDGYNLTFTIVPN